MSSSFSKILETGMNVFTSNYQIRKNSNIEQILIFRFGKRASDIEDMMMHQRLIKHIIFNH